MAFTTNANIQNGYYGKDNTDIDGNVTFESLGKEIIVENVYESLEDGTVMLELSFEFGGAYKTIKRRREEVFSDKSFLELCSQGADVTKKNFNIVIDTIRLQEEQVSQSPGIIKTYRNPGWITVPTVDTKGNPAKTLCYRSFALLPLNVYSNSYCGCYNLAYKGDFNAYRDMIRNDVIGRPALEYVFLMAMSSIIVGLIGVDANVENPILHLVGKSGTGKSTAGLLAASVCGSPIDTTSANSDGIGEKSLYSTWGSTENATIKKCVGNTGAVVVFNELGKFCGNDMGRIVYNLSEGTDKDRLNKDLSLRISEPFRTAFISTGEVSLLERCKSKVEGLQIRVLEITKPLTDDAAHADRIAKVVKKNYGFVAPKLANYIIKNGGKQYVLDLFEQNKAELIPQFDETPLRERFVSKFATLALTTAKIAEKAIGVTFDIEGVMNFIKEVYAETEEKRNVSSDSYSVLIEACRVRINNFIVKRDKTSFEPVMHGDIYGRVSYPNTEVDDEKVVSEEFEIRKSFVKKILQENGFDNMNSCVAAWKKAGVLDYEAGRNTRSRKLTTNSSPEEVYVLRVFSKKDIIVTQRSLRKAPPKADVVDLLADDEEEEVAVCAEIAKEAV